MPKSKTKSFEESLKRLEDIIYDMENNASLEQSIKLYKEGVELSLSLNEALNKFETDVTELKKTSDGLFSEKKFMPDRQAEL